MTEPGAAPATNRERACVALICFAVGGAAGSIGWVWFEAAGGISALALLLLGIVGLALSVTVFLRRRRGRGYPA
jgi:hypothetical protein